MRWRTRRWTLALLSILVVVLCVGILSVVGGTIAGPLSEDEDELGDSEVFLAPASEYATINETTGELEVRLDGTAPGIDGEGVNVGYTTIEDLVIVRNDADEQRRIQFDHTATETITFGASSPGDIEGAGIVLAADEQAIVGVQVEAPDREPGELLLETVGITVEPVDDVESSPSANSWDTHLTLNELALPATATRGDHVPVEATVENHGSDPGVGTLTVAVGNQTVTDEQIVLAGEEQSTVTVVLDLSRVAPDTYDVSATFQRQTRVSPLTVEPPTAEAADVPTGQAHNERGTVDESDQTEAHLITPEAESTSTDQGNSIFSVTVLGTGLAVGLLLLRRI